MENKNIDSKWSKIAITGFVLSITLIWAYGLGSITAIILGIVSIIKINKSSGKLKGKGFSIASIILGFIGLIICAIPLWILTVALWKTITRFISWLISFVLRKIG